MISIIIVTCNSAAHIVRCLEHGLAALEKDSLEGEVIIVDNASRDSTAELVRKFPSVRLIEPGSNLGFGAACNLGTRHSRGGFLLFLNPDTAIRSGLAQMAHALEHNSRWVAAGARLVDADGRPQRGFLVRRFPTLAALVFEILLINRLLPGNPVNRRYRCLDLDPAQPAEVDQPAGAALMVSLEAFEAVGGFDERFFPLWFEDVDLCLRLKRAGGVIGYCPDVIIEHQGGHSLESIDFSEKQVYWYRNLVYYVEKNLGWWASGTVRAALLLGMGLRIAAELIRLVALPLTERSSSRPRGPREKSRARSARLAAYWRAARVVFENRSAGESRRGGRSSS